MKQKYFQTAILLLALFTAGSLFGQSRFIRGKISGADSLPLEGALVKALGTLQSAYSNKEGDWSLAISSNVTQIEFAMTGYVSQTTGVPSNSDILNIRLQEDVIGISTITVTALGIKKQQRSIGSSVQTIKGSEVQGSGEQNVIQGISSKVAGALVTGSGGTPGASSKVILRGATSFTSENQPLIVVDGVPIDNSTDQSSSGDYPFNPDLQGVNNSNRAIDINPDDIDAITVLKGPAAAALYGVRGANGAIIITTKRGSVGGKQFSVDINSTYEISNVNKLPEKQRKYGQGSGGGTIDGAGNPVEEGNNSRNVSRDWGAKIGNPFNNEKTFFQTGFNMTNNIGVTVGGERTTARFSVGNTRQTGVIPNSNFNRLNIRVNTDTRLGQRITLGSSISMINSGGTRPQNGSNLSGIMLTLLRSPADFNIAGGEGSKNYLNQDGSQYQYFSIYDNPLFSAHENPFKDNVNRMMGNIALNYMPLEWLTATWRVGTDQYTDSRKQIFAIGSWNPDNAPGGEIDENILRYREVYSDLLFNITKDLSKDVHMNLLLGNNLNSRQTANQYLRGRDLAVPNFYNLSNASNLYASSSLSQIKTAAFFFNADFELKKYLYLNITGRNEWASTFGTSKSSFFYPSANMAFIFTEFMQKNNVLSFGKARLSYAQAGKNPTAYASRTYYVNPFFTDGFTGGLNFPYLGQNGFGLSDIMGNAALRPEKTTGIEAGLDLRFFKGRLNIDATIYKQTSTDILVNMPLAPSTGFQRILQNSGSMENKGIELIVNGSIVKKTNFEWTAAINFASNRNNVIKLAKGVDEIELESGFSSLGAYAIVNQPYGVLYGSRWARNSDGKLLIGTNGLPKIADTRGNIGNPYPKWYGGLRNSLKYKKVSLTFLWDVRKGGQIWNGTWARLNNLGLTSESADRNRKYVIEGVNATDGTTNTKEVSASDYYRVYKGDNGNYAAENAIQDGSWLRLRELGLSYILPMKSGWTIKRIEFGFIARNLFLFTKYKGVDPETSLTGAGSNIGGFDYFNNPGTKSFMFTVKLGL